MSAAKRADDAWVLQKTVPFMENTTENIVAFDGRIDSHPLHKAIYDLCQEIEKLPASEQATIVVSKASALQNQVAALRSTVRDNTKCLNRYAEECFPRGPHDGKVHFARAIMESVAEDLDAAFNPKVSAMDSVREKAEAAGVYGNALVQCPRCEDHVIVDGQCQNCGVPIQKQNNPVLPQGD